jgi:cytochrome d ubiquinol oxidase subunit I
MIPLASTVVDLSRFQFATTSIYHFLFVPLTLGLAPLVAIMQTLWHRTHDDAWLRLTRFFGTLLLINFAIGVATGLVQEFQFGMNWSVYSNFVGGVFGAPLAIEGLAAFAIEARSWECGSLAGTTCPPVCTSRRSGSRRWPRGFRPT